MVRDSTGYAVELDKAGYDVLCIVLFRFKEYISVGNTGKYVGCGVLYISQIFAYAVQIVGTFLVGGVVLVVGREHGYKLANPGKDACFVSYYVYVSGLFCLE